MSWEELCRLGLELPGVSVGTWYGTPALKVRGKGFVRLKEDGRTVVFLLDDVDDQELLVADRPALYYVTPHYEGYAAVLARLPRLRAGEARVRLEQAWRQKAGAKLERALEQAAASRPRLRPRRNP